MIAPTELRTERLLLRPFRAADVEDALAYRNDPEFARFLSHVPQPFTQSDAEAMVALILSEPWDRFATFAVDLDGELIGTVNLEIDPDTRSAMLGYAIGRAWWGQGIATEAARATIAWGIATYGLTRIWASTDVHNVRSQRVMEKLQMRREGVALAHHVGRDGEPIDQVAYGLDLPR